MNKISTKKRTPNEKQAYKQRAKRSKKHECLAAKQEYIAAHEEVLERITASLGLFDVLANRPSVK